EREVDAVIPGTDKPIIVGAGCRPSSAGDRRTALRRRSTRSPRPRSRLPVKASLPTKGKIRAPGSPRFFGHPVALHRRSDRWTPGPDADALPGSETWLQQLRQLRESKERAEREREERERLERKERERLEGLLGRSRIERCGSEDRAILSAKWCPSPRRV